MRNLAISSLTLAVESIRVCAELAEEIKHISQVKKAGRDFSFVAEKASTWFESIKALSKDFDDLESSLGLTSDVMWLVKRVNKVYHWYISDLYSECLTMQPIFVSFIFMHFGRPCKPRNSFLFKCLLGIYMSDCQF